jgi:hypothetical protein
MKKNILFLVLMVIVVFTACAGQKKTKKTPAKSNKLNVTYAKMFRTSCFGRCPNFYVEVYNTGLVRYTGVRFVTDSGVYEKNIGTVKAQELLNEFNNYRVDTLKDEYPLLVSDLPGINYTFRYGNITKKVMNSHYGPWFMKELAREVDKLVMTDGVLKLDRNWKRVASPSTED